MPGSPAASCADVGLTVETAATLQEFDDPDDPAAEEKLTALQYLEKADYKKVYLLFASTSWDGRVKPRLSTSTPP